MFNTTILDVAIGMIFVYLLLSLICSAANEMVEYLLKKRASDLERGIREILTTDGNDPGQLVPSLYNHGLVNSLFPGTYQDSGILSGWRYLRGTELPSYIPARSFALALMDLIQPGDQNTLSGCAGSTPPVRPNTQQTTGPAYSPPPLGAPENPLTQFRNAINTSPFLTQNARVTSTLISMVDAADNDVSKARENIETWFNSGMDRVSGWYKRRTQIVIFSMGLFVAIAINADSITIAKKLSTDRSLRDSLVAASDAYAKANATASPAPSTAYAPAASPTPTPNPCWANECRGNEDSPRCKLKRNHCALEALGLPIGWSGERDLFPGPNDMNPDRSTRVWLQGLVVNHGFGWLLTALAISLGAPFWFDTLNKFIVVRSTVKPKEKSPDEKSKD